MGKVAADDQGVRVLGAQNPLKDGQQRGVLVTPSGRIPRLPGPVGKAHAGDQGVRVLSAQNPLPDGQQRGVLVDASAPFPGVPLPPWPPAVAGEPYAPPTGRGKQRLVTREGFGRCQACARSTALKLDGTLIRHKSEGEQCPGSLRPPGELPPVANWLPLLPRLTEHGQRHGHQVTLDDLNVRYALQAERMGHLVTGMRGVYTHIAPEWRTDLTEGLQRLWEESLDARARLAPNSAVPLLDDLLAARRKSDPERLRSQIAPKIGH